MTETNTPRFVRPVSCPKCSGRGYLKGFDHVRLGECFRCNGAGQVEGDRATIAARKAYSANRTALGKAAFAHSHAAHSGLSMLEADEPERCRKAVAAFAAGDARVLPALVAYFSHRVTA